MAQNSIAGASGAMTALDRLTQKLSHLQAMLILPQDCDALERIGGGMRSTYLHAAATCAEECERIARELSWREQRQEQDSAERHGSAAAAIDPKDDVVIDRDILKRINDALLVGFAAFAELERVKSELEYSHPRPDALIAQLKIKSGGDPGQICRFATVLHLTAMSLEAVE